MVWRKGADMTSNIFSKNLSIIPFEKHGSKFYESDQYYEKKTKSDGQETNHSGVIGSTRTTNDLEDTQHAVAATSITMTIISLNDAQKEFDFYQQASIWFTHWSSYRIEAGENVREPF